MFIDNTIKIGLQKRGGNLFNASALLMKKWWDFEIPDEAGTKAKELCDVRLNPNGQDVIEGELLCCRLESAIDDIQDGYLDIAIVSDDALAEWEAAKRQTLDNKPGFLKHQVGDAGSQLMIGVSFAFLNARLGMAWKATASKAQLGTIWEDAVTFSYENGLPIFTTFKEDLEDFLREEEISLPPIIVRNGTVEAQARLHRTELCPTGVPVIADLVVTGNSMRDNFFEPVKVMKSSNATLIANMPPKGHPKRPAMSRLITPIINGKSIMDVNRLLLSEPAYA